MEFSFLTSVTHHLDISIFLLIWYKYFSITESTKDTVILYFKKHNQFITDNVELASWVNAYFPESTQGKILKMIFVV